MAQQRRGRTRREDDSLVPLLTGLVVLAAAGPALYTALTQWLVPRLSAGSETVTLTLDGWWDRNWWLVLFWGLELVVLFGFLAWSRRRRRRRIRQLDSVVAGLSRVLPSDWDPARHLRVLRWRGHHPVRLRVELTPRSPVDDPSWRESVTNAARTVLGPLAPVGWPAPPRGGVFDWARRPPRIELQTAAADTASTPAEEPNEPADNRMDWRSGSGTMRPLVPTPPAEELKIYRRPRPAPTGRATAEHGSAQTQHVRED